MEREKELKIIELHNAGKTYKTISEIMNYSDVTIKKILKKYNYIPRTARTQATPELIEKLKIYLDEGKTNSEIAKILHSSEATIRKYTRQICNRDTNSIKHKNINNKELILTDVQKEVLYGSLLGDMSIGINYKNARISINQGGDQEEYFDHKCKIFNNILGAINKKLRYDKRINKCVNQFTVRTLSHPVFTKMYLELYPNGIKSLSEEWLNRLTPRSLAYWFMDDGTNSGALCTHCFTDEENLFLQKWFLNKWNIITTIHHQDGHSFIYITKEGKRIFAELVKEYIIPSMEYKLRGWIP